jgi:hypothetical protein
MIKSQNQKPWKVSREQERLHCSKNTKEMLELLDKVAPGSFYVVDYRQQKVISGSSSAKQLICGHSKDLVSIEGLDFYKRILVKEELEWLNKMNEEAHNILHDHPADERQNLVFTYDLIAKTADKREVILRHKLVPYRLCKNGNMWLGLCHITTSTVLSIFCKAMITNTVTGENYDFVDGKFVLSEAKTLTPDEIAILTCAAKDMPVKQICATLHIPESRLKRKRLILFNKLQVRTVAAAIYKATVLKII